MYTIKRVKIGGMKQLEALALEWGRLYSETVTFVWRTVRKQGLCSSLPP